MKFKYDSICSGLKIIKVENQNVQVSYFIDLYDNLLIGNICIVGMPEVKSTESHKLTGECPIESAKEMLHWLEQSIKDAVIGLNEEIA